MLLLLLLLLLLLMMVMVVDHRTPLRGRRGKRVADGFLDVVVVVLDDEDELLAAGRQPFWFEEHCWFGGAYCIWWRSFVTTFIWTKNEAYFGR